MARGAAIMRPSIRRAERFESRRRARTKYDPFEIILSQNVLVSCRREIFSSCAKLMMRISLKATSRLSDFKYRHRVLKMRPLGQAARRRAAFHDGEGADCSW